MSIARYAWAVLIVALVTLPLWLLRDYLTQANISLIYLLAVLITALFFGTGPSLLASILSFLTFNFFLVKPYYTLLVADPRDVLDLVIFFISAAITGRLAVFARQHAQLSAQAQRSSIYQEADKLKTALLHAISHDLRTPLTVIKTSVSNLLQVPLTEPERIETLTIIDQQANQLNRMVGNLLDFSRLQAGVLHINLAWNALEEVAGDVTATLFQKQQKARISLHFPADMPLVRFDYGLILQALTNITENTLRYEPDGGQVEIIGGWETHSAWLLIRNHGPSIPSQQRELIMTPFYHGEGGNIGLGLAIAKGIIEAHQGQLGVEDTPGGGATFRMVLPRTAAPIV